MTPADALAGPRWLTQADVAREMGVSSATVRAHLAEWIDTLGMPRANAATGLWPAAAIAAWIARGCTPPPEPPTADNDNAAGTGPDPVLAGRAAKLNRN